MQTELNRPLTDHWSETRATSSERGISIATLLLPLRLFLGISFIAAGWDKLSDPTFFNASAPGYIGTQLAGFAPQSPLGGFLTAIAVPNATLFGALVLAGELAIGFGTILGLFSRTAAIFGCILSLTLWLTASWQVTPFFLGSDLPYAMGWLTLALAPAHAILSLDAQIKRWRLRSKFSAGSEAIPNYYEGYVPNALPETSTQPAMARRRFVQVAGATALAGTVTGVAWATTLASKSTTSTSQPSTTTGLETNTTPASTTNPTQAASTSGSATAATTAATSSDKVLASVASLAVGSAVNFTTPDTNETAILIHEADGSVKAFSNICTHQGCEVAFNKSAQVLACPCHGAQYSIESGAVLRGPATRALKSFSVKIENGNIVYSQS